MAKKYPIALLEDPCDEADFVSHGKLTAQIGTSVEIVGDDLYCTNPRIVAKGIQMKVCSASVPAPPTRRHAAQLPCRHTTAPTRHRAIAPLHHRLERAHDASKPLLSPISP